MKITINKNMDYNDVFRYERIKIALNEYQVLFGEVCEDIIALEEFESKYKVEHLKKRRLIELKQERLRKLKNDLQELGVDVEL